MTDTIHVACGDYALDPLIKIASIASRSAVYLRDDLSCGPLGPMNDLDSWWSMRQTYWEHPAGQGYRFVGRRRRCKHARADFVRGSLDRVAIAGEVIMWLGTGLAEQLALAWIPQLLDTIGGSRGALHVVQFESTSRGKAIVNLSHLSDEHFQHCPSPRPVDAEGLAYLDEAWRAVIAPIRLRIAFLDRAPCPLPLLRAAFQRLIWRYPYIDSGINRFEHYLLANVRDAGPIVARVIALSLSTTLLECEDCVGDNWLFWRLQRLADPGLPHPAVVLTGERNTIRGTEVSLTPDGKRFLGSESNFVKLNGIDDWVGGVHIHSRSGAVWFQHQNQIVAGSA